MSIVKEGYIEKCGPKICPTWNKRWLVLYNTRVLEYFSDQKKKQLKGVIELDGSEKVTIMEDERGKTFEFGFHLTTAHRVYKFAAKTNEERRTWYDILTQATQGKLKKAKKKKDRTKSVATTSTVTDKFKQKNPEPVLLQRATSLDSRNKEQLAANVDEIKMDLSLSVVAESEPDEHTRKSVDLDGNTSPFQKLPDKVLTKIINFVVTDRITFSKLFCVSKWLRKYCISEPSFYKFYTVHLFPRKCMPKYSTQRNATHPWIAAHGYESFWVFGYTDQFRYPELKLRPFRVPSIRRLFLDDFMLWEPDDNEVEEMMAYLEENESSIHSLTLRSFTANPKWIKMLPELRSCYSLHMQIYFQREVLHRDRLDPRHLKHLSLTKVDLISDESIDDTALRVAFENMKRLLTLHIEETRWKHAITLPPQVKFFRYVPSDVSLVDLNRLIDDDEAENHLLNYELNYACDMVINHRNWPSVLTHSLLKGHEALQSRRMRVWVLKKKRKWDGQVMNVNYCLNPPPLGLFEQNTCYGDLCQLDQTADMSAFWCSPNADRFTDRKKEPPKK